MMGRKRGRETGWIDDRIDDRIVHERSDCCLENFP